MVFLNIGVIWIIFLLPRLLVDTSFSFYQLSYVVFCVIIALLIMVLNIKCICVARKAYPLLFILQKERNCKLVPFRCYFKWGSDKLSQLKSTKKSSDELPPLTGIDDPNFSEHWGRMIFDIEKQKTGFKKFLSHAQQFCKEELEDARRERNFCIDDKLNKVDILYKFDTPTDLQKFIVKTDSSYNMGYSSASFNLTENETAIFSGNINSNIPKSGTATFAGYANLTGPTQERAFFRSKPYDWTDYTHLVFKIRGDGRTYLVILHTPNTYEEVSYTQYFHLLHTRGGPYWQIAKLPFSHFIFMRQGKILDRQNGYVPLHNILRIGITTGAYEGPFKLELDYIGLENMGNVKKASPFELYRLSL